MKPEQKIQNKILDLLTARGVFHFRVKNTASYDPRAGRYMLTGKGFKKGVPDIVCIAPTGKFVGIEVKRAEGGKVSPEQVMFKKRVEELGGEYHIVRSVADVEGIASLFVSI